MSELDITRLLNDKVVDFGNERFLEGWNGAIEHIIKLLEEKLPKTLRLVYEVCLDETGLYDANEAALVKDAFIELIKGEK